MRVAKETVVGIEYTLKDDQGNIIDASGDRGPMEYLHGAQNIIPGLEQGIEGLEVGDTKNVLVPPNLGYGEYSDKLLQRVPIEHFGANTPQVGMRFHAETNLGMRVLTIKQIEGTEVVLDGNHALAGKTLHFDIKVASVRAAELTELSHGHPHQSGGFCGGGGCCSGEASEGGCCSSGESSEGGCCSSEEGASASCCGSEQPAAEAKSGGCGNGGCGCGN
ncbi:MAG: peptidylprolyl isomerase [Verrucomicrobia bacterium]|nr:peptidylprolyl isomerase [Verrucomicrobiota bacterium]